MVISTAAIIILTADLIDCVFAATLPAHASRGRRPDQGIRGADTPHTQASGAWSSFDGHTYVLIY
jgi:hypothetical protein